MEAFIIPSEFQKRIMEVHGSLGKAWLKNLPQLLSKYGSKWGLRFKEPLLNLSYNFLIHVVDSNGTEAILKAGVPNLALTSEIFALETYAGHGCIRLIKSNLKDGVFLIDKARPGYTLKDLTLEGRDDDAVQITSNIIKRLHKRARRVRINREFQPLASRADGFEKLKNAFRGKTNPFDIKITREAEAIYHDLINTTEKAILLHGDLHHFNIVRTGLESWLAIDPQGIMGDPCFEVASFIRNPLPELMKLDCLEKLLDRRIRLFSEYLGFDRERIWQWTFTQTVLSSWWLYEDHGMDWKHWYELSIRLLKIR